MSARVLFGVLSGFFFGISSIAVPALAVAAGADLRGASIGGAGAPTYGSGEGGWSWYGESDTDRASAAPRLRI